MEFSAHDTAFVVIDPQNDVLSEKGVAWALVGRGIRQIGTVEHQTSSSVLPRPTSMTW